MILDDILRRAGATAKSKGNERTVDCPFCVEAGLSPDQSQHLGLNAENWLGHCFRCGWKSRDMSRTIAELSRVYGLGLSVRELLRDAQVRGVSNHHPTRKKRAGDPGDPFTGVLQGGLPDEFERFRFRRKKSGVVRVNLTDAMEWQVYQYLKNREISDTQIRRFQIGYAAAGKFAGRAIFPVFLHKKKIIGAVGRAIDPETQPKYLNNCGQKLLWGAHRDAQIAILCEGIFDALAVERSLASASNPQPAVAVATLGCAITKLQLWQLEKYQRICIFPDEDEPGVRGAIELALACMEAKMDVWTVLPEKLTGDDPGSMSSGQIKKKLQQAIKWAETTAWRMRAIAAKGVAS